MPNDPRIKIKTSESGTFEVWCGETLIVGAERIKLDVDVPGLHLHTTLGTDADKGTDARRDGIARKERP